MCRIASEICFGGCFLEDCFYCHSQQIISAVANESLTPYNLIERAPEVWNLNYCNTECEPKPNQNNVKYRSLFRTKGFFPNKYKQK